MIRAILPELAGGKFWLPDAQLSAWVSYSQELWITVWMGLLIVHDFRVCTALYKNESIRKLLILYLFYTVCGWDANNQSVRCCCE